MNRKLDLVLNLILLGVIVLMVLLLLLAGRRCSAQELPFKPLPTVRVQMTCRHDERCLSEDSPTGTDKWWISLPVRRRTLDRKYWLLAGVSAALTVGDIENSMRALREPGAREANPVFGAHPSRAKYYAICIPLLAVDAAMAWHYKRQDDALRDASLPGHKWHENWTFPLVFNGIGHAVGLGITAAATGK